MIDYNDLGKKTIDLINQTGKFIRQQRALFTKDKIEKKGTNDFVSYVDKTAESMLVKGLKVILPQSGFIAEEQTAGYTTEEYIWIIDPLDGTTNFIHNVAPHAISVALMHKTEIVLGIVYEIAMDEMFYSWQGIGAYCNQQPISVSSASGVTQGLIATGFPINQFNRLKKHMLVIEQVVTQSHGIRRHGSAATDLAYVAAGRFDCYFELGLNPWDIAAGYYLVKKAGGLVSDYSDNPNCIFSTEIIAGTPAVYTDVLKIVKSIM